MLGEGDASEYVCFASSVVQPRVIPLDIPARFMIALAVTGLRVVDPVAAALVWSCARTVLTSELVTPGGGVAGRPSS